MNVNNGNSLLPEDRIEELKACFQKWSVGKYGKYMRRLCGNFIKIIRS